MANIANIAATNMEHLCNCSYHGYSWGERWGSASRGSCYVTCEGHTSEFYKGDRDCSSSVIDSWQEALIGTDYEGALSGATYTGNMRSVFTRSGLFEWKPMSFSASRGDIYLNEANHTAMCLDGSPDNDILGEFCINEFGEVYGGQPGDQTGRESRIAGYYSYPWDGILHYNGKADSDSSSSNSSSSNSSSQNEDLDVNIKYALRVSKGNEWLDTVINFNNNDDEGYAGITGEEHNGFRAKVSRGNVKYRCHTIGGDWSKWYYDGDAFTTDGVIDGITVYYKTPDGEDYQQAWYRSTTTTHPSYLDVCCDDGEDSREYDGWCGLYDEPLDQIQICITNHNPF